VFIVVCVCDVLASRYLVRYIKREVTVGFYISMVAKAFVVIWWVIITIEYLECRSRYLDSLKSALPFWNYSPYPSYRSVRNTYNGLRCLADHTHHDDRTLELIALNLAQAIFFRVGSMIYGVRVAARFGGGLKAVFYKELAAAYKSENEEGETKRPEGGTAIKFVATKKKKSKKKGNSSLEDQEMMSTTDTDTSYQRYEEDSNAPSSTANHHNNNKMMNATATQDADEDEEEYEDAMMAEHGISRREMEDDGAW